MFAIRQQSPMMQSRCAPPTPVLSSSCFSLILNLSHQSQMDVFVDEMAARRPRRPSASCRRHSNRSSSSSQRRRPSTLLFALLLLIALSAPLLPAAQCATFFYGATEDSDAAAEKMVEQQPKADEHTLALAESAAAHHSADGGEYDDTRLSQQELESVFKFCSLLPLLEEAGHVIKNEQARQVCDKLVAMLKPMFRKRNKAIRPRRAMMMASGEKRRR